MAEQLKKLVGEKVIGKDGNEIDVADICGEGKIVGLYYSAHWCPPCRAFTPKLVAWYEKVKGKGLEIIFVSCDRDESGFKEYYGSMPWLAMPYDDKYNSREETMLAQNVRGVPTLVFMDGASGAVLSTNGRGAVDSDPDGEKFPSF